MAFYFLKNNFFAHRYWAGSDNAHTLPPHNNACVYAYEMAIRLTSLSGSLSTFFGIVSFSSPS
jgi:hypothetical protein